MVRLKFKILFNFFRKRMRVFIKRVQKRTIKYNTVCNITVSCYVIQIKKKYI